MIAVHQIAKIIVANDRAILVFMHLFQCLPDALVGIDRVVVDRQDNYLFILVSFQCGDNLHDRSQVVFILEDFHLG
jgi:hypothetical protein